MTALRNAASKQNEAAPIGAASFWLICQSLLVQRILLNIRICVKLILRNQRQKLL